MHSLSYHALTSVSSFGTFQDVSQVVTLNGSWKDPIEISDSDSDSDSVLDIVQPLSKSQNRKRNDHYLGVIELTDSDTSESDSYEAAPFSASSRRGVVKVGALAGANSLSFISIVC